VMCAEQGACVRRRSWAGYTINMFEFEFPTGTTVDAQVEANLGPFRTAVELIMSIPGIKNLSAHVIVSEIGIDMSRFPSAAHLISWACVCPRNDESAGKR
jgi:Transposase IS116/IS110/IS902 family